MPSFSPDFKQAAYVSGGKLWRSRADGEDQRPIAPPGLPPFFPRWSPDGRTLLFVGNNRLWAPTVYTIAIDGGVAKPVLPWAGNLRDPDWSPDGSQIELARDLDGRPWDSVLALIATAAQSRFIDIPGSENLIFPRWSPGGRLLAATAMNRREIRLYDFVWRNWRVAVKGKGLGQSVWSTDGARLFYQDDRAEGVPVLAFDVRSAATKTVARFDRVLSGGNMACYLAGLARGDILVMDVVHSGSDLYGAEIELP